jgi:hypothetical protein
MQIRSKIEPDKKKLTHQDLATTKGGELTVTYSSARKYCKYVVVTEFRYKTNGARQKIVHKTAIVVDFLQKKK